MSQKTRPTGVTILAVLEALGGLVWLLVGAGMMMVGALMPIFGAGLPMFFGAIAGLMGFVFLIFGIIAFVLAYGLFTGKGWAWLWSLVFAVIGIILALFEAMVSLGSGMLPIIIYLVIIYYLTRSHVKTFFGK
jgi:hypothetical protein